MAVDDFELFHGAVLVKLIRKEKPVHLSMFETNIDKSRCAYLFNDDTHIYVKHSKSPKPRKRGEQTLVWKFNFTPKHVEEICGLKDGKEVGLALVCGEEVINNKAPILIAFMEWPDIEKCFDFDVPGSQLITVKYQKGCNLHIWGRKNGMHKFISVNQSALDDWKIVGS